MRPVEHGSPVWWTKSEQGNPSGPRHLTHAGSTIAFTCNGLRALGVDDTALATFPEEFRHGMAARAAILGIAGDSGPDRWVGDLASPALHAIVILFARTRRSATAANGNIARTVSTLTGVTVLSALNLEALPPFDGVAREHFGYRDRLSHPSSPERARSRPLVQDRL